MKYLSLLLSSFISFLLMPLLLFLSFYIVCYLSPNYFKKEFIKYNVPSTVSISLENLLKVNSEMMDYLIDKNDNLSNIKTTINGIDNTPFFNEKEIAHMADVKNLFLNSIEFSKYLSVSILILFLILFILTKNNFLYFFSRGSLVGIFLFFSSFIALSLLILSDFSKYFIIFHHIFFTNDLWLLNPETDRLINIVPEGFFLDTTIRISLLFIFLSFFIFFISLILKNKTQFKAKIKI